MTLIDQVSEKLGVPVQELYARMYDDGSVGVTVVFPNMTQYDYSYEELGLTYEQAAYRLPALCYFKNKGKYYLVRKPDLDLPF